MGCLALGVGTSAALAVLALPRRASLLLAATALLARAGLAGIAVGDVVGCHHDIAAGFGGDRLPDQFFDGAQQRTLVGIAERHRLAFRAGARRAADAVDISLRHLRQFEIDDMADIGNIDAPCCDIGRDQYADLALLEPVERALALALALVAMDGGGGNLRLLQMLGHLVGAALGAGEDEGAREILIRQKLGQHLALGGAGQVNHPLLDAVGGLGDGGNGDLDGVLEEFAGELADLIRHGGREEQVLAARHQMGDDLADRAHEAEVQHLVGLVEHEDLRAGDVGGTAVEMVDQAAGRGDEHIEAARQRLDLRAMADAAEDDRNLHAHMASIGAKTVGDLGREFARRREHEHAAAFQRPRPRIGLQAMENRQCEGSGLAGAGLGDAEQVLAFEDRGNRLRLNGGGCFVALGRERLQEGRGKAEFGECGDGIGQGRYLSRALMARREAVSALKRTGLWRG